MCGRTCLCECKMHFETGCIHKLSTYTSVRGACVLELTVFSACGDRCNVSWCACVRLENRSQLILWITSSQEQLKWDLAMLKCQVTSFSYGIPGESKCFQCSEELKHFNSIAERFNHQFNYHGEQIFVNDYFFSIFLPLFLETKYST